MPRLLPVLFAAALSTLRLAHGADDPQTKKPPQLGDKAPDFQLNDLGGKAVSLSDSLKSGPVALVVLRGYPGYQCPICTKQFGELLSKAKKFTDAKATIVFVYPGSATDLDKYAKEFVASRSFPDKFRFLLDPDFKFTEQYGLRWNAANETAYPSSFVIDSDGVIQFAKVSHSHGDRASSDDLLKALEKIKN